MRKKITTVLAALALSFGLSVGFATSASAAIKIGPFNTYSACKAYEHQFRSQGNVVMIPCYRNQGGWSFIWNNRA